MSLMRSILLAGSQNRWLRERAPKHAFVRRAVSRFMPGEELEDMLRAVQGLAPEGIHARVHAPRRERHGSGGSRRGRRVSIWTPSIACAPWRPPPEPSVKLTQLGLDFDRERCYAHLRALAARADALGNYLWIDMEGTPYVDMTLDLTRRVRAEFPRVGVCLQAYLYRTADDLAAMIEIGAGVRLVKGAYSEPRTLAFPKKADVDANYRALAETMIGDRARSAGVRAVLGTHDVALIDDMRQHARAATCRRRPSRSTCCTGSSARRRCGSHATACRCASWWRTARTGFHGTCAGSRNGRRTSGSCCGASGS